MDDNDDVTYAWSILFERWGWLFLNAESVAAALRRLRYQPDLIFLDLKLLDGSGLDVLKKVRETGMRSKVIIVTSQSNIPLDEIHGYKPDKILSKNDIDVVQEYAQVLFEEFEAKRVVTP